MNITEKQIENSILEYLETRRDCIAWKNQSVGVYDPKRNKFRKSKNRFHKNGVSDIICMMKDGFVLFLEVKTQKGRQTEDQKKFEQNCDSMNQFYRVVRSIEETIKAINEAKEINQQRTRKIV